MCLFKIFAPPCLFFVPASLVMMVVRWMCGVSLKDRKSSVDLYSLLGLRVWLRWWSVVDWGGLGMWSVRVEMIGCQPVEMWWWQGWDVRIGAGRHRENVWRILWMSWVCTLNGWCSGICGEALYREKRLSLAERGRDGRIKNKWWWWWMNKYLLTISFRLHDMTDHVPQEYELP